MYGEVIPTFVFISCHLGVQKLGIHVLGGVRVQVLGVQVRGGVSVSNGGCPGDAPDRPPPTQWWGVSNNLPSDLSHSDEWDNFLSQRGAWVARD